MNDRDGKYTLLVKLRGGKEREVNSLGLFARRTEFDKKLRRE